ncbi:gluconokinase [Deinococcus sp. JMULE3]|nr:gluconokinase, GntK/IdnK-type [Deinococcus sp. JMULE3]NTX99747.1 gluconokinase [Deinococcus sp. JMULE3]
MGVSGSGKTTLGRALGAALHAPFLDGDDHHTPQARARMHAGHPLTDADRAPWLARLRAELDAHDRVILACSALKRPYRDALRAPGTRFLHLHVPEDLLRDRLRHRHGHYAGPDLLPSQLTTLQPPQPDEPDAITLHVTARDTPADVLRGALARLQP